MYLTKWQTHKHGVLSSALRTAFAVSRIEVDKTYRRMTKTKKERIDDDNVIIKNVIIKQ